MSAEVKKEIELELAHVLFIDIVGYSKLLINDQRALLDTLNQIVRSTDQFRKAEAAGPPFSCHRGLDARRFRRSHRWPAGAAAL